MEDKKGHRKGGAHLLKGSASRPGQEKKPRRPRRRWKDMSARERALRVLVIVAVVLAVVFVAAAVAVRLLFVKPDIPAAPSVSPPENSVAVEDLNIPGPKLSGERKSNFYTFLVIGRDTGGGGNTDTLLLAAYDVDNQALNVMSIPRDTMVNVSWDIKKINSVYNMYGGGDEGLAALGDEISQLVGFVPDYQVVVEWAAVGELVDAIGGVWFDVPRNMNYDDPTQDLHIHIKKGYQLLSGEQAMGVIRYRHDNDMSYGYANGDLGRIETQQAFLKAVVEQCLQIENVTRIGELARIFNENVTTNLSVNNLLWFGMQAILGNEKDGSTLDMDSVNFFTMPNEGASIWSRSYGNYQSYVVPLADELVDLVNEYFNPYLEELTDQELDIMGVDSSGRIYSSTGYLEDSRANSRPSSSGSGSSSGGNSSTSRPSSTPAPAESEAPEETPLVSPTPGVSENPEGSVHPEASETPVVSQTPESSTAPSAPVSPEPGASAQPEATPAPQPSEAPASQAPVESSVPVSTPGGAESQTPAQEIPASQAPAEGESGPGESQAVLPPEALA